MNKIYLDHAATTYVKPEVIEEMTQVLVQFGNPSSTHSFGRSAKSLIESSRKQIAALLGAKAKEILFNSCATEGNNWIIQQAVKSLGVTRIISSEMEHHAVLYPVKAWQKEGIAVEFVKVLADGQLDLVHLESLLQNNQPTLVSLMHINNETGIINDLVGIGNLCKQYSAYYHADMVQSVGKYPINLAELPVDFMVASAHKFHGPKGAGLVYVKSPLVLQPTILGGEQEKGYRAGTEAPHQIVGMAKALELSYEHLEAEHTHIQALKQYTLEQLQQHLPGTEPNGNPEMTTYNILNVRLPLSAEKASMLLFALDMKNIAISRGSACQSGSGKPSHVLACFLNEEQGAKPNIRISFAENNTKEEIDYLVAALTEA